VGLSIRTLDTEYRGLYLLCPVDFLFLGRQSVSPWTCGLRPRFGHASNIRLMCGHPAAPPREGGDFSSHRACAFVDPSDRFDFRRFWLLPVESRIDCLL
jgi:hypothetical protein